MKNKCLINYVGFGGNRTSMLLTPSQKYAMKYLCDIHNFKRLTDYIYYVMDKDLSKKESMSFAVKEYMFRELVDLCIDKGGK